MTNYPLEATAIYLKMKKSKPWARLYLILVELWEENCVLLTSKDIEERTDFVMSSAFAWQMLDVLTRMKLISKIQKGKKDTFALNESLFINKKELSILAKKTIIASKTQTKEVQQ